MDWSPYFTQERLRQRAFQTWQELKEAGGQAIYTVSVHDAIHGLREDMEIAMDQEMEEGYGVEWREEVELAMRGSGACYGPPQTATESSLDEAIHRWIDAGMGVWRVHVGGSRQNRYAT